MLSFCGWGLKASFLLGTDYTSWAWIEDCLVCAETWERIKGWIGIRRSMTSLASGYKWLKKEARGSLWLNKAKRIAFACAVYHLWTARNRYIFESEAPSVESIISRVKTNVYIVIFSLYPYVLSHFESLAMGL